MTLAATTTLALVAILVELLDEFKTTIVVIITEDEKNVTKHPTVAVPHRHEDLGQLLVAEVGRQATDGFWIGESSGSRIS